MLKDAGSEAQGPTHVIFIDKNHPSNGLRKVVSDVNKHMPSNVVRKLVYLIP
jgi:hypothetical protein